MSILKSNKVTSELIFIGHAGYILKKNKIALLMDPWVYGKAFMGSWHANPYLEPEIKLKKVINILSNCQDFYIWISHEHSDHFDQWFIKRIIEQCDKEIKFLIPAFPGNSLKKRLAEIGAKNIISMDDLEQIKINDFGEIQIFFERPYYSEHSSILIKTNDLSIFHNSDSTMSRDQLIYAKNKALNIDIYIGQYGPSSPFPQVMEWEAEKKKIHQLNHEKWALNRYFNSKNILKPSIGLMCAGPASINNLEGEWEETYSSIKRSRNGLKKNNDLQPSPFSVFFKNSKSGKVQSTRISNELNLYKFPQKKKVNTNKLINKYITDNNMNPLKCKSFPSRYLKRLKLIAPLISKTITIEWRELCQQNPQIHTFFFNESKLDYVAAYQRAYYSKKISGEYNIMKVPKKILDLFFSEQITWDELSYSRYYYICQSEHGYLPLFIQALRCIHNEILFNNFLEDNYKIYKNNSIEVCYKSEDNKPRSKKIKRYCPHQNFDLKGTSSINKNVLTCPMHGHRYNLDNGLCIFGDRSESILIND